MNGKEIRAAREALMMTQEQLARAIGTTTVSVNRWENGKTPPRMTFMLKLITFFKEKGGTNDCKLYGP